MSNETNTPETKDFSLRDYPKTAAATLAVTTALSMNAFEGTLSDQYPPKDGTQGVGNGTPRPAGGYGAGGSPMETASAAQLQRDKHGKIIPGTVVVNPSTGQLRYEK